MSSPGRTCGIPASAAMLISAAGRGLDFFRRARHSSASSRKAGDRDAGMLHLVLAIDRDQHGGQRLGHDRIGERAGVERAHAGIVGQRDDLRARLAVVAADQHVAIDRLADLG